MDRWIAWEAEERMEAREDVKLIIFSLLLFCSGELMPELCAQRVLRAEDFLC